MCGICGLVNPEGLPPDAGQLTRAMAGRIAHRGPDEEGFLDDPRACLGSRRLSIVDIAGGHQPISSEDGSVHVVYNGEIYNFQELRRELRAQGHVFKTSTDTEVVVHAYEQHGPSALARLNGIFALALWDSCNRRLLLARDPLGVKPLYYAYHQGTLAFASEVKALLGLPWISREVDPESLRLYLSFRFVPSPRTLFRGIRKVGPGEALLLEPGKDIQTLNFVPPPKAPEKIHTEAEMIEAFRVELRAAVRRQLMGDVPVGVLLSGGMDSAAILALSSQYASGPVHAYTVGFENAPDLDESELAAFTARHFGAEHETVRVSTAIYRERLMSSLFALDEPVATPSVAPFDELCRLASRRHKVVLSGQGADEPFGGYLRHRGEKLAGHSLARFLAGPAALASEAFPRSEPLERAARTLRTRDPLSRYAETLALFPTREVDQLLPAGKGGVDPREALEPMALQAGNLDTLARFLYLDARFGLADDLLLYTDKISMASSLEVRVPFLDLELLRFAESVPSSLRVRLVRPKSFLKRALSAFVPPEILNRPKRNFMPPESAWLASQDSGPNPEWLLEPKSAARRYLDSGAIERILADHRSGRRDRRRQLFALLTFELWHRTFIDPSQAPTGPSVQRAVPARPTHLAAVDRTSEPGRFPEPVGPSRPVTHFGPGPHGPGGMSSALRAFAGLTLAGYRFQFVTTFHPELPVHSLVPFMRAMGRLAFLPRDRFGITHFHLSKGGSFVREGMLLLLARARGLHTCATIHSGAFPDFMTGHATLARMVLSRADRVLVLSEVMRDQVQARLGIRNVIVLPNLVQPFRTGKTPAQCPPRVLFGGDVCAEKGVDTLLEGWPLVRNRVPEAELVIAGPSRGLLPRPVPGVSWMGPVPHPHLLELLGGARVAVLPSRCEGMPMFALEAMALGRPLVATAVGTLPELLQGCGTLIPVGDAPGLAEALATYLLDPATADLAGKAARERIESDFSPEGTARALKRIYDSLFPGRSSGQPDSAGPSQLRTSPGN